MNIEIKVYIANLKDISLVELLTKYKDYIKDEDLKRMNEYSLELNKKQIFISSILKNKYISSPITYTKTGKPVSENIFFNISHSQDYVVMAMTKDANIGIDIEQIKDVKDETIRYCLSNEELSNFNYENKNENFYLLWTKKEAVFKCKGTGITKDIKNILTNYNNYINSFYIDDYIYSIALECNKDEEVNITIIKEL